MTFLRSLAVLGLALIAAIPVARAQQAIGLVSGNSFNLYGLNLAISGCTIGLNGAGPAACSATDKLELLQVASHTNTITYEVIGYVTGIGIDTSAALSSSGGTNSVSQLNLTLLVTPNGGYPTNTTRVTSGTLTTIGNDAYPTSGDGSTASASAAFSAGTTATTLTDALTAEINSGSPTLQTVTNGPNSFSPSSASFTITENLLLDPNNQTVNTLKLNSVALRFTTTPEPASIAILLFALGGLAAVRRRRAS